LNNQKTAGLSAILWLTLVLAACSPTRSIILMPDRDGHVGKAEVSTSAGKLALNGSGVMTHVTRPNAPPSSVVKADSAYIAKTFGEALSVEPAPSSRFTLLFETGTTNLTKDSAKDIATIVTTSKQRMAIGTKSINADHRVSEIISAADEKIDADGSGCHGGGVTPRAAPARDARRVVSWSAPLSRHRRRKRLCDRTSGDARRAVERRRGSFRRDADPLSSVRRHRGAGRPEGSLPRARRQRVRSFRAVGALATVRTVQV